MVWYPTRSPTKKKILLLQLAALIEEPKNYDTDNREKGTIVSDFTKALASLIYVWLHLGIADCVNDPPTRPVKITLIGLYVNIYSS